METNLKASLIICTYNREELFVETVQHALKQNYPDLEIIIVDQTKEHTKATTKFLDSVKDKINYIFSEAPSITKARNIGIKNASGDILIFIDDDTKFDENFVSNHIAV
ncbi:MAG: glycosyltransferase family 2 protein, partial [Calditrichaeota bacterium]